MRYYFSLKGGEIIEAGSHDELIIKRLYAQMHTSNLVLLIIHLISKIKSSILK